MRNYRQVQQMMARNTVYEEYARKVDKTILKVQDRLTMILITVLMDKYGYAEKRMKRVMDAILALKCAWKKGDPTSAELLVFAEKKGIDVGRWMKSIPMSEKFALAGYGRKVKPRYGSDRAIESTLSASMLLTVAVLKVELKMSTKDIKELLNWISYYINSYATGYVTDKIIWEQIGENEKILKIVTVEG